MDIISKALEQAERILKGVRANYIIVMPDGETRVQGDLKLAAPEAPAKRQFKFKRGELKAIYGAPIDALDAGEVWKCLPLEGITPDELRAAAGTYAARVYGNENVMTSVDNKAGTVEILRLA
jgi:hypothetical protein